MGIEDMLEVVDDAKLAALKERIDTEVANWVAALPSTYDVESEVGGDLEFAEDNHIPPTFENTRELLASLGRGKRASQVRPLRIIELDRKYTEELDKQLQAVHVAISK